MATKSKNDIDLLLSHFLDKISIFLGVFDTDIYYVFPKWSTYITDSKAKKMIKELISEHIGHFYIEIKIPTEEVEDSFIISEAVKRFEKLFGLAYVFYYSLDGEYNEDLEIMFADILRNCSNVYKMVGYYYQITSEAFNDNGDMTYYQFAFKRIYCFGFIGNFFQRSKNILDFLKIVPTGILVQHTYLLDDVIIKNWTLDMSKSTQEYGVKHVWEKISQAKWKSKLILNNLYQLQITNLIESKSDKFICWDPKHDIYLANANQWKEWDIPKQISIDSESPSKCKISDGEIVRLTLNKYHTFLWVRYYVKLDDLQIVFRKLELYVNNLLWGMWVSKKGWSDKYHNPTTTRRFEQKPIQTGVASYNEYLNKNDSVGAFYLHGFGKFSKSNIKFHVQGEKSNKIVKSLINKSGNMFIYLITVESDSQAYQDIFLTAQTNEGVFLDESDVRKMFDLYFTFDGESNDMIEPDSFQEHLKRKINQFSTEQDSSLIQSRKK